MRTEAHATEWSLADHLAHGEDAIKEVELIAQVDGLRPKVCFHFLPLAPNDEEPWSEEATFCRAAKPLFEALPFELEIDYVGGLSGIEAWDFSVPSIEWLHSRIEPMLDLAGRAGLRFEGWSFEPTGGPIITVSPSLAVVKGNKLPHIPEGVEWKYEKLKAWITKVTGS